MNIQAIHQLHAMVFDGLGADFQDVADLFGVLTFSDELEDFALTPRQLFERAVRARNRLTWKFFGEWGGDYRFKVNLMVDHTLQGRLGLLGPGFGLFRARLRKFRAAFGLLGACFRRFSPGFGLLGPGFRPLGARFRLPNPRLCASASRRRFFSHGNTLCVELRGVYGV